MRRMMSLIAWIYRGAGLILLAASILAGVLFYLQDAALIKQGASVAAFFLSAVLIAAGEVIGYLSRRAGGET